MSAFLYGIALQWKLDIRSKALLITCYVMPLAFFAIMGGVFTSIDPTAKQTLIQSMTIFGVTMGAVVGLPPLLAETYGSDVKSVYKANGVPLSLGVFTHFLSAFIHLLIVSGIMFGLGVLVFQAELPADIALYFGSLTLFIVVSLAIGCALGLLVKETSKLTMITQFIFLPSIMLSGIMFPVDMLPKAVEYIGFAFPASWSYRLMCAPSFSFALFWPLLLMLVIAIMICAFALKRKLRE